MWARYPCRPACTVREMGEGGGRGGGREREEREERQSERERREIARERGGREREVSDGRGTPVDLHVQIERDRER